jgi:hypothetical protein
MRSRTTLQDFHKIDPQVCQEIRDDLLGYVEKFTARKRILLNHLLKFKLAGKPIYIRQDTLAHRAGYKSREHVNRTLKEFEEVGFIASNYRHKTSCMYQVASYFMDPQIRAQLAPYFHALFIFPLALLTGSGSSIKENVTQTNSIQYFLNTTYYLHSKLNTSDSNASVRARERVQKTENRVQTLIPDYVEDIQSPVLTVQQKMQLAQYTKDTIRYGLIQLQRQRDIQSPVGYLLGVCRKHAARDGSPQLTPRSAGGLKEREVKIQVDSFEYRQKKSLARVLGVKGDSEEAQQAILNDPRPYSEVLKVYTYRTRWLDNIKAHREGLKLPWATVGIEEPRLGQDCSDSINHESFEFQKGEPEPQPLPLSTLPTTQREYLAQVAGRQLAIGGLTITPPVGPRRISEIVPKLVSEVVAPAPKTAEFEDTYIPESTTRIELDESKPGEWYNESEWEEIFT